MRRIDGGMLRVGLIGCGNIGSVIAEAIDSRKVRCRLVSVYDKDTNMAKYLGLRLKDKPKVVNSFQGLLVGTDIIVEAASQKAVRDYAPKALAAGKSILIMSSGALLDKNLLDHLVKSASKNNARIYIPSGAVSGVDGIKSASVGGVKSVLLQTTKPPKSLAGYEKVKRRKVVFEGPASEAVRLFPANVNVAAVLSLAGVGSEKTKVRIIADPSAKRNIHEIFVYGSSGRIYSRIENIPSPGNPRTSYLACLSAIKTLADIGGVVSVGT